MRVIVLGAGVIGVSTAWYLRAAGHEVTVVDRQPAAGLETSFANGGQISVSYAEPWASTGNLVKIIKWLGDDTAPLLFRLQPDLRQWWWGLRFLRETTPARFRHNIRQMVNLASYSRCSLQALRAEIGLDYEQLPTGILQVYSDDASLEAASRTAQVLASYGCERTPKTADECLAIEPALRTSLQRISGGAMTEGDESGDALLFTQRLAERARQAGVRFLYNTTITRLLGDRRNGMEGVEVIGADGQYAKLHADHYVLALGSFSPQMVAGLGARLNIYPAKGYSATYAITDPDAAPTVSVTDDAYKIVFTRLGNRLRLAGTAEIGGYDRSLNPARCDMLTRRAREMFPHAADYDHPSYWSGLRPSTPSNVPYIGQTGVAGLWVNAGHGTLGWTMAAGSGRALADLVSRRQPEVDFAFCGQPRGVRSAVPQAAHA